jgi:hypothetical protein
VGIMTKDEVKKLHNVLQCYLDDIKIYNITRTNIKSRILEVIEHFSYDKLLEDRLKREESNRKLREVNKLLVKVKKIARV